MDYDDREPSGDSYHLVEINYRLTDRMDACRECRCKIPNGGFSPRFK